MKLSILDYIPPVFSKLRRDNFFKGNCLSWDEALAKCTGYSHPNIVEKVKDALLKVKNGDAMGERDSVNFDKVQYSWPLLSFLMWVLRNEPNHKLNLIDFGGSLGTSYYQNRKFTEDISVEWKIVEQENFVEYGKKYFQDERLSFYKTIEEAIAKSNSKIILLCGVLQYLKEPYSVLKKIFNCKFEYIFIDRTTFHNGKNRIAIQNVPSQIYKASYPCWIFNESLFLQYFEKNDYKLITDFSDELGYRVKSNGYIYRKKLSTK